MVTDSGLDVRTVRIRVQYSNWLLSHVSMTVIPMQLLVDVKMDGRFMSIVTRYRYYVVQNTIGFRDPFKTKACVEFSNVR